MFPHRFKWDFVCSCFWGDVQETFLRCFGGCEGGLSPRRSVLFASNHARPRPATPLCAPTRIARGMSGFWTRQVPSPSTPPIECLHILVDSKARTYHGRVGSGRRTAGQRGGAEPGRTGRRPIGPPRRQLTLAPPKASSTTARNHSSEARTSETLWKPMG